MKKYLGLVPLLLLVGCVFPRTLPHADDLNPERGRVVLLGKVELVPPFEAEKEQDTHWNVIGDGRIVNKLYLALGEELQPVSTGRPRLSEWQSTMEVVWNEPFILETGFRKAWVNGGLVQFDAARQDFMWFPGGLAYSAPEGVDTLYIGTLRYYRDDFNNILSVEVLDEWDETLRVLGMQDQSHKITKALFQPGSMLYR